MIPNIKGEDILEIRQLKGERVDFIGRTKSLTLRVRQPTISDLGAVAAGAQRCSAETTRRFTMLYPPYRTPDTPLTICHYPTFKPGDLGYLYLIMEVDSEIVGFGRHYYTHADDLPGYQIQEATDTLGACSLCITDEHQGKGLGTLYGQINKQICKHLGAQWLVGCTYIRGGMTNIRLRDGFEVVEIIDTDSPQARIRKRL